MGRDSDESKMIRLRGRARNFIKGGNCTKLILVVFFFKIKKEQNNSYMYMFYFL